MGVPGADVCLCGSQRCYTDVQTLRLFCATKATKSRPAHLATVTFDNVAVDRGPELLPGLLVEVLAVDDPHLFEESRLAALASAEQKDLHQPLHVGFLPGETSVDLLGLSELIYLAAVQQADGQTNF